MSTPTEGNIQVSPQSSGEKVRTLKMQIVQADGTLATVGMQVVMITDENGDPLIASRDQQWKEDVLVELRRISRGLIILSQDPLIPDSLHSHFT